MGRTPGRAPQAWVPLLLAVALMAACGRPAGGIAGQVFIGPMCPVIEEGVPCPDQPYQATIAVRNARGRQIGRFRTDAEGRFRVALPPGTYTLVPESPGGPTVAPEQQVTVAADQYTAVTITYESGIR